MEEQGNKTKKKIYGSQLYVCVYTVCVCMSVCIFMTEREKTKRQEKKRRNQIHLKYTSAFHLWYHGGTLWRAHYRYLWPLSEPAPKLLGVSRLLG